MERLGGCGEPADDDDGDAAGTMRRRWERDAATTTRRRCDTVQNNGVRTRRGDHGVPRRARAEHMEVEAPTRRR